MPAAEKPTVSGAPLRGSSVRPPLTTLRAHAASAPMSGMAARPPRNVRLRMSFPSGPARRFSAALTMCLFLNVAESHFKPSSLELSKPPRFQEIAQTACERFGLLRDAEVHAFCRPHVEAFGRGMHQEWRLDDKSRADAVVGPAGQGAA